MRILNASGIAAGLALVIMGIVTGCGADSGADPLISTVPKAQRTAFIQQPTAVPPADTSILRNPPAPVPTIAIAEAAIPDRPIETQQPVEIAPTPKTETTLVGGVGSQIVVGTLSNPRADSPDTSGDADSQDESSPEMTKDTTPEPEVVEEPTRALDVDEINREAMKAVESYTVAIYITSPGSTDTLWLTGRYEAPGRFHVSTEKRAGGIPTVVAAEHIGDVERIDQRRGGFEAVLDADGTYVRYRDLDIDDGQVQRSSQTAETSEWFRLEYSDWPADRPDIFVDPSGLMARLLPHMAAGFPPALPDNPDTLNTLETRLVERNEISDGYFAIPREISPFYTVDSLYFLEQQYPFDQHPNGVSPDIGFVQRYISKEDFLTRAIMVNYPYANIYPTAEFIFTDYNNPDHEAIPVPESATEFDRAANEDSR